MAVKRDKKVLLKISSVQNTFQETKQEQEQEQSDSPVTGHRFIQSVRKRYSKTRRTSKKETGLNPRLMSSSWGSSPWESTGQAKHPELSQSPHNLQIWQAHFLSGELPTSPCWRRTGCKDPLGDPKRGEDIALGALYRAIITHYRFTRSYPSNPARTFSQSLWCAGLCTAASQTGGPPPFHPFEIIVLALSIITAKDADGPGLR